DVYTFTATAGQQLLYDGLDNDFDNVGAQVLGPGDVLLANINSDSDSDIFTVPVSGTYRVVIFANTGAATDYAFRLLDVTAANSFNIGDKVSGDLGALGRNAVFYNFAGTAGQQIIYDGIGSNNDNVIVDLYDPTGRKLYEANADFDSGRITLPTAGTYRVEI